MSRHAAALALFFLLSCPGTTVSAACWEVSYRDGQTLNVPEFWQIKSRFDNHAELVGKIEGKDSTTAVDDLQAMRFGEKPTGWSRLTSGGEIPAELELRSGARLQMQTKLPLIYPDGRKNRQLPLESVASVTRCAKGAEELSPEQAEDSDDILVDVPLAPVPSGPHPARIYMMNSDVLGGICRTDEIIIKSEYALLSIETAKIDSLQRKKDDAETIVVNYNGNNRVTGRWIDTEIKLEISPGQVIGLETGLIRGIDFSHRSDLLRRQEELR